MLGTLEFERRGGRTESQRAKDDRKKAAVKAHIQKFDKAESHYTRKDSQKLYVHPELNAKKMHEMFSEENKEVNVG